MQQLAKSVDTVLTEAYIDIYGEDGESGESGVGASNEVSGAGALPGKGAQGRAVELVTSTSPLSASEEVLALFSGGLADFEAAAPPALHAIGLSQAEIEAALDRQRALVKKQEADEKEAKANQKKKDSAATSNTNGAAIQLNVVHQDAPGSSSSSGVAGGPGGPKGAQ